MRNLTLSVPEFGFVIGTRVALAFGLGLLSAGRIPEPRRRTVGLTLLALGALTTIPAARAVFRGVAAGEDWSNARDGAPAGRDAHLVRAGRFPRKGNDDDFSR